MSGSSIAVVVVDQALMAHALGRLLSDHPRLDVRATDASRAVAVVTADPRPPDVIVVSDRLSGTTWPRTVEALTRALGHADVVLLTSGEPELLTPAAYEAGCAAVVSKSGSIDALLAQIGRVHAGERLAAPSPEDAAGQLSVRELEVLTLLVEGMETGDIAERLFLSVNTVRNHVQHIINKLTVHTRLGAVSEALRRGIVSPP
jgi:DNA-binding NarL/FixJ family response regulator